MGSAHNWLNSYLSGRSNSVWIGSSSSSVISFICGVPQGSVLGPVLFSIYISPIVHIASQFMCANSNCNCRSSCGFKVATLVHTCLSARPHVTVSHRWLHTTIPLSSSSGRQHFQSANTASCSFRRHSQTTGRDLSPLLETCETAYSHLTASNQMCYYFSPETESTLVQSVIAVARICGSEIIFAL